MKKYFPLIDVLRFLAALSVVFFHYFSSSFVNNVSPIGIFLRYGFLGVELFFIISGFVIYFSIGKSWKEYALGRFLRLYPTFWILCTLTYIATVLFPHGNPLPFVFFLKNLFIVNNGQTAFLVDGSYWTLTEEIFFYVFIGVFVFLFKKENVKYFFLLWLGFSWATFFFGLEKLLFTKLLLARYVPYFAFGGILAFLVERWGELSKKEKIVYTGALTGSAILPFYISHALFAAPGTPTNRFGMFDEYSTLIVASFFILVPLAVFLSRYIVSKRIVGYSMLLGGITYPLYLIHQRLGGLIVGDTFGSFSLLAVLVVIGMVLFALIFSIYEDRYRKKFHAYCRTLIGTS